MEDRQRKLDRYKEEKAVLVGVVHQDQTESELQEYLDELAFLTRTAGATPVEQFVQKIDQPDPKTLIRKGKLNEIKNYIQQNDVSLLIFDDDLTGSQITNIEKIIPCKVLDRSHLILDIFALRARTAQAKTQVELAKMQYLLPRLKGMWTHLERQRGGIGLRGPGEKEIETDKRIINDKIALLKSKLAKIEKQDLTRRKQRGEMIRVSLVGYTNVGKSTIMNLLSKSQVFAENKLFATLDTTVRKVVLDRVPFLLSDTVGFIRKLPLHLVESFKSTLDEVRESDIIVHVVDVSHPHFEDQMKEVDKTLQELEASDKKTFIVFNKMDLYREKNFDEYINGKVKGDILNELRSSWMARTNGRCVFVSAQHKENIDTLRQELLAMVKEEYQKRYPYRAEYY
jgi:GTP-binding protein HflX